MDDRDYILLKYIAKSDRGGMPTYLQEMRQDPFLLKAMSTRTMINRIGNMREEGILRHNKNELPRSQMRIYLEVCGCFDMMTDEERERFLIAIERMAESLDRISGNKRYPKIETKEQDKEE